MFLFTIVIWRLACTTHIATPSGEAVATPSLGDARVKRTPGLCSPSSRKRRHISSAQEKKRVKRNRMKIPHVSVACLGVVDTGRLLGPHGAHALLRRTSR